MALRVESKTSIQQNLYTAFMHAARLHSYRAAFKADGGCGRTFLYSEVAKLVSGLASGLIANPAVEIGILSENRPEWPIAYLAIVSTGKTVVPIDASLKENEILYIIGHARLRVIFTVPRFAQLIKTKFPEVNVYSFDDCESTDNWLAPTQKKDEELPEIPPERTAVLIYTSGTTGDPKAVELTHKNLLANLANIESALQFNQNDTFLSVLPLHHTFEATCGFLTPVFSGATIVYARSLKSKEILEDIAHNGVTLMCGVPLLYEKVYQSINRGIAAAPLVKRVIFHLLYAISGVGWQINAKWGKSLLAGFRTKTGLGTIRMFVSGGAALPQAISRFFNYAGFDFLQGYGMTECSPVISVNRPDDNRFGSVGPPLDGVEVRIGAPDSSGIGEILVRGDNITPGYRNKAEETAKLIKDGWLHTGDLGRLRNGHLWITGRKKNVIVSAAGKNIYPEQIEEKLIESRFIIEAVVFGRPKSGKQGEEVGAVVVPDLEQFRVEFDMDPQNRDEKLVYNTLKKEIDAINGQMAEYKRIVFFDISYEELEKTSTKKVKRFLYK